LIDGPIEVPFCSEEKAVAGKERPSMPRYFPLHACKKKP